MSIFQCSPVREGVAMSIRGPCVLLLLVGLVGWLACGGGGGNGGPGGPPPLEFANFQEASVVVGQADFTGKDSNRGGPVASDTLFVPRGPTAQGSWYVVDGNNRVLGFPAVPTTNGPPASFVLGQGNFSTATISTTSSGLGGPSGLSIEGERLAVADAGNHRVLIWNTLPTATGTPADVVVGQPDFVTGAYGTTERNLQYPIAVCIADGRLFVADSANHRVLIWNSVPTTNYAPADVVLGHSDFVTSAQGPLPTGMHDPSSIWSDGRRLVVADAHHRVLIWNSIPTVNDVPADVVVGQPDLYTITPTLGPQGLEFPQGVCATDTQLFIADTNHHRVLIYTPFPTANHAAATTVLGQSHFNHQRPNDDDQDGIMDPAPSARTMRSPSGVSLIDGRLIVTDWTNHRVLIFDSL